MSSATDINDFFIFALIMHTLSLTYHPSNRPHTSGVRLGPCGSLATNTCRPTACTERAIPPPSPSTANSKLLTPNWIYTLYAVKGTLEFSFGERKTKEDGTYISMMADEGIMKTMTYDGNSITGFIVMDNREKMIETFNFMADNTNVEWAMIGEYVEVGSNTLKKDLLYTNHANIRCDARFDQVASSGKNYSLDYHRHSHPNRYTGNNPLYAIMYPTTSQYPSSKDRDLRDAASPSNYVSVRPVFILRNQGNDIFY